MTQHVEPRVEAENVSKARSGLIQSKDMVFFPSKCFFLMWRKSAPLFCCLAGKNA